jgi:hypothetical protein
MPVSMQDRINQRNKHYTSVLNISTEQNAELFKYRTEHQYAVSLYERGVMNLSTKNLNTEIINGRDQIPVAEYVDFCSRKISQLSS